MNCQVERRSMRGNEAYEIEQTKVRGITLRYTKRKYMDNEIKERDRKAATVR